MLTSVKQYTFNFISDGASTAVVTDCSILPIKEDFRGNLPIAVLSPAVQSIFTGPVANVTAQLVGQKVTLTFQAAPPRNDGTGNLIVYTASFYLQYGN